MGIALDAAASYRITQKPPYSDPSCLLQPAPPPSHSDLHFLFVAVRRSPPPQRWRREEDRIFAKTNGVARVRKGQ